MPAPAELFPLIFVHDYNVHSFVAREVLDIEKMIELPNVPSWKVAAQFVWCIY